MTAVTSITLFKTDEGFELRFDGSDIPRPDQRERAETLREAVQIIRKVGLEMTPTAPTNILGPPLPQGEVDELMEAQKRADAVVATELAPHTADLGDHVERLREARPEFVKKPLPPRQLLLAPVPMRFPLVVRGDAQGFVLDEHEGHALNRLAVMPVPGWPGSEPLHVAVDWANPIKVERDNIVYNKYRVNLEGVFR